MWIREGCRAIMFPTDLTSENTILSMVDYIRSIFRLSHEIPIFITLEPTIIPVKVHNMKRLIAFPPLSAIICDNFHHTPFDSEHVVVDGTWAEIGTLTPYISNSLCGSVKVVGIDIDINEDVGTPYLCIEEPIKLNDIISHIISGGFIEITRRTKISNQKITLEISQDYLQLFIKTLIDNLNRKVYKSEIRYEPIILDKYISIYATSIAMVEVDPVILKFGKGFVFALDINHNLSYLLYHIYMLISCIRDPKAQWR